MTKGEQMIGITFQVGNNTEEQNLGESFANQIDRMERMRRENVGEEDSSEFNRLISISQSKLQEAYWASSAALKLHQKTH